MSGFLNDRIVEQGTIRGHFSEVASRTRVDRLEGLPTQNARIITGAGADDCEWGVRKTLVSAGKSKAANQS